MAMLPALSLPPPQPPRVSPPPSPTLRLRTQSPSRSAATSIAASVTTRSSSNPASFTSASSPSSSTGKSPRRSPARGYEQVYRDLSPSKTLRAIGAHAGPNDGGTDTDEDVDSTAEGEREGRLVERLIEGRLLDGRLVEEDRLVKSIRTASGEDRAFARRAAETFGTVRERWREIDAWDWPRDGFDIPGGAGEFDGEDEEEEGEVKGLNDIADLEAQAVEDGEYWGSLPARQVLAYEKRLEEIADELEELDIEDQKNRVLHTHVYAQPTTPPRSDTNRFSPSSDYVHLGALTALTTATVLQALPYYSQLINLMNTWSSRILVLKNTPPFLKDLESTRESLDSAWVAFGTDLDNPIQLLRTTTVTSRRQSFENTKAELEEKISSLGRLIDLMLDALEGSDEKLPEYWIDAVDNCETDYSSWTVEAQKLIMLHESRIGMEHDQVANGVHQDTPVTSGSSSQVAGLEDSVLVEKMQKYLSQPSSSTIMLSDAVSSTSSQNQEDVHLSEDSKEIAEALKSEQNLVEASPIDTNDKGQPDDILAEDNELDEQELDHPSSPKEMGVQEPQTQQMSVVNMPEHGISCHQESVSNGTIASESSIGKELKAAALPNDQASSPETMKPDNQNADTDSSDQVPDKSKVPSDITSSIPSSTSLHDAAVNDATQGSLEAVESKPGTPYEQNETSSLSEKALVDADMIDEQYSPKESPTVLPHTDLPPPLNAAMMKRGIPTLDGVENSATSAITDPVPPRQSKTSRIPQLELSLAPSGTHKGDEQLDRQISSILKTVPVKINFSKENMTDEVSMKSSERESKSDPEPTPRSSSIENVSGLAGEHDREPALTLAPVLSATRTTRSKISSDIKLYYLTQPGREKPIKLFIRLIGDGGERVMVRVGGGWADLGQYLRDHVSHQSRAHSSESYRATSPIPVTYRKNHSRHPSSQSRTSDGVAPLHFFDSSPTSNNTDFQSIAPNKSYISSSGTVEDEHLGLAGPGAKKNDIGADQERWVEEMVDRAKRVGSGTETALHWKSKQVPSGEFTELGRTAGVRRVTSRAASRAE